MTKHVAIRRGVVAALGLALAAAFGLGGAASSSADTSVGNIDGTKNGTSSLTIHKFVTPNNGAGAAGTGVESDAPQDAVALNGVQFSVTPITGIDLTKQEDWKKLDGLGYDGSALTGAGEGIALGTALEGVSPTEGQGVTAIQNLSFGAYAVAETDSANVTTPDGKKVSITQKVAPFIVTVPFPNAEEGQNGWVYDVHVYPKNSTSETTKTVSLDTPTTTVGSELWYEVTGQIPQGGKIAEYQFVDALDENLTYDGVTTAPVVTIGDTAVTEITPNYDAASNTLTISFGTAAVTQLNANAGATVTIKFATKVKSVPEDGSIPNNGAHLDFKNEGDTNWTEVPPGHNPNSFFGDIEITKVSASDAANKLQGAEFKLYAGLQDGGTAVDESTLVATVVTDADGIAKFSNLFYGHDGEPAQTSKDYYLVESKAPAGFQDPTMNAANPQKITLSSTTADVRAVYATTVTNDQVTDIPQLPLTGAQGKVLLSLGGLVVLLAAAGTVIATRRNSVKA